MDLRNVPIVPPPPGFKPDCLTCPPANHLDPDNIYANPMLLARQTDHQPLPPGVYQTYPWSIILVVPPRGIDDRSVLNMQITNSPMPAIEPPVEVLPKY
jgi:hypothetical protein